MQFPEAVEFSNKLEDMIKFLIPNYISEGKKPAGYFDWMYRWKAQISNTCK